MAIQHATMTAMTRIMSVEANESPLQSHGDCFSTIGHVELLENILHVHLHSALSTPDDPANFGTSMR